MFTPRRFTPHLIQLSRHLGILLGASLGLSSLTLAQIRYDDFEVGAAHCDFHLRTPLIFSPNSRAYKWEEMKAFRLMTYNLSGVENFFAQEQKTPKPEERIELVFKSIREGKPMIAALQEVESAKSLTRQVERKLNNRYVVFSYPGNDRMGKDIAVIVDRRTPLEIEFQSHKHHYWRKSNTEKVRVHTRDVVAAIARRPGDPRSSKPVMILLMVHNKTQVDSEGDVKSKQLRNAQLRHLILIKKQYELEYGKDVAIAVLGDFNMDLQSGEADLLGLESDGRLRNTLIHAPSHPHESDTHTHFYFGLHGRPNHAQLDGIWLNLAFQRYVRRSWVIREGPAPKDRTERNLRGSDHDAVIAEFDLTEM